MDFGLPNKRADLNKNTGAKKKPKNNKRTVLNKQTWKRKIAKLNQECFYRQG